MCRRTASPRQAFGLLGRLTWTREGASGQRGLGVMRHLHQFVSRRAEVAGWLGDAGLDRLALPGNGTGFGLGRNRKCTCQCNRQKNRQPAHETFSIRSTPAFRPSGVILDTPWIRSRTDFQKYLVESKGQM